MSEQIHAAIGAIMAEIKAIPKGGTNDHFGYSFRSFEQVIATLQPIFVRNGVYPTSSISGVSVDGQLTTATVTYRLTSTKDGSHVETAVLAQGKDNADKGAYKLMSGALKYAYGQMLMIPFEGDDAENSRNDASKPRVGSKDYQTKPALTEGGREVIVKFNGAGNKPTKALVSSLGMAEAEDALKLAEWRRGNTKGKYAKKNEEEASEDVAALEAHLSALNGPSDMGAYEGRNVQEYEASTPNDEGDPPF